ncbi:MAG: VWA domain-containing protein [Armatimonadetes bacterium]|nr:VWA domain-containing protein [Armatimonadota bacterium]
MDPTQKIDPNRTMLTGAVPNFNDPLKTQMISAGGMDPNKTSAMAIPSFGGKALAVEVIPSREATMANGPAREQFLISISAAGSGALTLGGGPRTPLNLCLVIDRSGSMEGQPLEYVKQACNHVVDLMSPDDVLSIVTFEEVVDLLMPPQRVTNKQMIKDGIQRLMPGNTTNLYEAINMALAQVMSLQESGRATRVVLLTDGDPTAGIKDFHALTQLASDVKSRGVSITFLGFGPDYNEELIASMAKKGGGNYYYIPRPDLIPEVFRTELEKLMTTSARNLNLEIKPARWVTLRTEQTTQLTDLERGSTIEQVVDLEFSNHPLGHYRVAVGKLTYDDMVTGKTETVDMDLIAEFTSDQVRYSVEPNPRVRQAAQVVMASKAVEKTMMGMKTGQLTAMGAISELQKTQALLLGEGRTAEAQEVTMALRALQSGDAAGAEKTLMGAVFNLDQGKRTT